MTVIFQKIPKDSEEIVLNVYLDEKCMGQIIGEESYLINCSNLSMMSVSLMIRYVFLPNPGCFGTTAVFNTLERCKKKVCEDIESQFPC